MDHSKPAQRKDTHVNGGRTRVTRTKVGLLALAAATVVSLILAGTASAIWRSQTSPITDYQYGVKFVDANTGWSVGANGTIQATTTGGSTWTPQTSGTTRDLNGVDAVSATTAWVVGDHGVILKTSNGGATWAPLTSGTTQLLLGVDFLDANVGYAVGDNGTVLKTINGGTSWTKQTSGQTGALAAVSFRDANDGIAVGDLINGASGRILRTTNGGSTWSPVTTGQPYTLYDVCDLDATHAWAVGDNGTIMKSTDDGQTWTLKESSSHYSLDAVDFIDANNGWAVGSDNDSDPFYGTIRHTTDGGETWSTQTFATLEYLYDVNAVSTSTAYAVGSAGVILKASSGGVADTTAPVTTDDAPAGWVNHAVTVTLTPTDNDSGVVYTNYTLDFGAPQVGTSVSVAGDGTHHITYFSVDGSGNIETTHTATVRIDTTAPATTDNAPSTWQKSAVTVNLTAADGADSSGVSAVSYKVDGGSLQTGSSVLVPAPGNGSNDGTHTITYYATDNVGNGEAAHSCTVKIDATAPTLSDDAPTTWQGSDQTVHLAAADPTSGVASVTYSLDGGQTQTGATVAVSGDGTHTIVYRAADVAGNVAADKTATVRIDKTAPATSDDAPAGWHNAAVTVHLTPSDASSGVATTHYRIDNGALQTGTSVLLAAPVNGGDDGTHTIAYYSTDNVGNTETARTATVKIDASAPHTTDNAPAGWNKNSVTVTLTPGDGSDSSGVQSTSYKIDGGAQQNGTSVVIPAPANGSDDGTHTITYSSTDAAGNLEATKTATVHIDTTTPSAADTAPSGWQTSDTAVTLTPSDPGGGNASGVQTTQYRVDGGSWTTGTTVSVPAPADGSDDGTHTVSYKVSDVAGNTSAVQTATVQIDASAPDVPTQVAAHWVRLSGRNGQVSATYADTQAHQGSPVTVTLTLKNSRGKLIQTWSYADDASGTLVQQTPATSLPKDSYRLVVSASDAAGNVAPDTALATYVVR